MTRLRDAGNLWKTVKELDVQALRDEAEQPVRVVLVGEDGPRDHVAQLLMGAGDQLRYPGQQAALLEQHPSAGREQQPELTRASLVLLAVSGAAPLSADLRLAVERLSVLDAPLIVVVTSGRDLPRPSGDLPAPRWAGLRIIVLEEAERPARALGDAILEALPQDLHLSAARRLPGLRPSLARALISETSISNATYALTSGLPELVPILNIPLAAADILVLTKNQALLVYKLALAFGAPPDFTSQMQEIMPVIGGGFLWRQVARELVGLIPGFGLVPKVAVSYAGTYAVGVAAQRWYGNNELLSSERISGLLREGLADGRDLAKELVAKAKPEGGFFRRLGRRVRAMLPWGKKDAPEQPAAPALPAPPDHEDRPAELNTNNS